jgi:hypothetical protein
MASMTATRRVIISALVLTVASAVFGVMMLASSSTSSAMPGMALSGGTPSPSMAANMPGMDMSGSKPSPSMAANMPGMDMSGSTPSPSMAANMPGMDMSGNTTSVSDRPLAPVLGTFGVGAVAVLLTAGLLRRRDGVARAAKKASRALMNPK